MEHINIGIIGTDSSHSVAFTELLNNPLAAFYVPGGEVVAAFSGGSADFPLSADRVEGFMATLETQYKVRRLKSPEAVASYCDAILLTSADGRVHADQFKRIVSYGKPIFIDKPLALSYEAAQEIFSIAKQYHIPLMSSSALRYAEQITGDLERWRSKEVTSADVVGPLSVELTQSYYYWYGIHTVELLYAIMGSGCLKVNVVIEEEFDFISAYWKDGRSATVRLSRCPGIPFSATIKREEQISNINIDAHAKPFYASLLEQIMKLFNTGVSPLDEQETLEIIRFIEASEESRQQGRIVRL